MTAQTTDKQPPPRPRPIYIDTEVEVQPWDLERAGWRYVGDDPDQLPPPPADVYLDAIRGWHDATHPMPWTWCTEQPCVDVREIADHRQDYAS